MPPGLIVRLPCRVAREVYNLRIPMQPLRYVEPPGRGLEGEQKVLHSEHEIGLAILFHKGRVPTQLHEAAPIVEGAEGEVVWRRDEVMLGIVLSEHSHPPAGTHEVLITMQIMAAELYGDPHAQVREDCLQLPARAAQVLPLGVAALDARLQHPRSLEGEEGPPPGTLDIRVADVDDEVV